MLREVVKPKQNAKDADGALLTPNGCRAQGVGFGVEGGGVGVGGWGFAATQDLIFIEIIASQVPQTCPFLYMMAMVLPNSGECRLRNRRLRRQSPLPRLIFLCYPLEVVDDDMGP